MKKRDYEKDFKNWMIGKNIITCGNRQWIRVLHSEVPLYKPMYLLEQRSRYNIKNSTGQNVIGRFDLLIRYRKQNYVSEIKYMPFTTENFWSALKCLAYCAYYNWQQEVESLGKFYPAIFLPEKIVKLEHKIIANKLGIKMFGITKKNESWVVNPINFD